MNSRAYIWYGFGDMGFGNCNISNSNNDANNNSGSHAFVETTERRSINNIAKRRSSTDLSMHLHPRVSLVIKCRLFRISLVQLSSDVMDEDDQDDVMMDVDAVPATDDGETPESNVSFRIQVNPCHSHK